MKRARGIRAITAVIAVGTMAIAGCTSAARKRDTTAPSSPGSTGSSAPRQGGTVTISNEQGQTWTCEFNPYNPSTNLESVGFVYEPLVFVNLLRNQEETPMLASSYKWTPDKKSITFTLRTGVTWSDGKPFTADDVVFTFDVLKKFPATDLYSLWKGAGLESVTSKGNTVTMAFAQPAQTYFFNFANQIGIVPKHIWSTGDAAAHPDSWADKDPIGTGPYKVDPC